MDPVGERDEQDEPSVWRWFLGHAQSGWWTRVALNVVIVFGVTFLLRFADGADDPGEPEKLAYFWVPASIALAVLGAGVVRWRRAARRRRR
jgi:hypothetical protein